ncbi:MAG: protein kinase [bacterium]
MVGSIISHYRILEKLGKGGMGVVYKAEDTKLKRSVALKFLPLYLTRDDEANQRFIYEAQTASSLDHQNLCTIYEIDDSEDGQMFIAMAYYQGETLKQKVASGTLQVANAIDIAIQIAQGLAKAHEKSIIHRDIKPANIIVQPDGSVKIIDFGLSKLLRQNVTKDGVTKGTVVYMSPEQAQGKAVDTRTDIWALGVVLYEMLTGRLPFQGDYDSVVIYSIVNEHPEPITALRTTVQNELEKIVNTCLAKEPSGRYTHMDELLVDLLRLQKPSKMRITSFREVLARATPKKQFTIFGMTVAVLFIAIGMLSGYFFLFKKAEIPERTPIAVVDFVNETDEKELDGLSGLLITALEQSRRLSVLTRSRMFDILKQLNKEDVDRIDETLAREICQQADVSAMAIASIRKFGQVYTIDLKVLDPQKNEYLFTTKVDGKGQESIPSLIDRLSEETRKRLKEKAEEIQNTRQNIVEVTTTSLEAYQHYFLGKQFINKLKFQEAEDELRKAIAIDSTFALAYYQLAYASIWFLRKDANPWIQKAMNHIQKVPEKEQYLIRALKAIIDNKMIEAISLYKAVIKSYPNEKDALFEIGDLSYHSGDYQTAETHLAKVLELDPAFERALGHIIWTYWAMGHYDKGLEFSKQYVARSTNQYAYDYLAATYNRKGDFENAFQTYRRALVLFPNSLMPIIGVGQVHIFKNEYEKAEAEFKKLLETSRPLRQQREGYNSLAMIYAYMGRFDEVLDMSDKVIEIDQELRDTTDLAMSYINQAFWLIAGRNDEQQARQALTKGLELVDFEVFNFSRSLFHTYLKLGEFEKASDLENNKLGIAIPFLDNIVNGYSQRAAGQYEAALKNFQISFDSSWPGTRVSVGCELARGWLEAGQNEKAIESIEKCQQYFVYNQNRAVMYSRSFYLLGTIYEKMDNFKRAIENYEIFLQLWKDADEELPELLDAKARLKKLTP